MNSIFQVEKIEQLALIDCLPPHHDPPPPLTESSGSESWFAGTHEHFFNSIDPQRHCRANFAVTHKTALWVGFALDGQF